VVSVSNSERAAAAADCLPLATNPRPDSRSAWARRGRDEPRERGRNRRTNL